MDGLYRLPNVCLVSLGKYTNHKHVMHYVRYGASPELMTTRPPDECLNNIARASADGPVGERPPTERSGTIGEIWRMRTKHTLVRASPARLFRGDRHCLLVASRCLLGPEQLMGHAMTLTAAESPPQSPKSSFR